MNPAQNKTILLLLLLVQGSITSFTTSRARLQLMGGRCLHLRGGSLAQEFAEELAQRRAMGQNFENLTPEQYRAQGLDGASYNEQGLLQFMPPGSSLGPFCKRGGC